ncbi:MULTISPECIES: helix-turn-helix domain-containing protein [unclassified Microbacterium]|uniref:helix-turn-helix domain-containing protein n=1 Tax=unclassified Microbacterium TaxID=2609290 RepID=UPI000C2CB19C|nr:MULTISPECIES: helix-turn-helix domain-containing protein [unclassified Microbacterium]
MTDTNAGPQYSTTVARAAMLLQLLAENPDGLGITVLTRHLNTQRAPLYRILEALIRARLVRRDDQKRYRLGIGTIQLARAYSVQFPAGLEQLLAELANDVGVTSTLVSAEGDVLTTVLSVTPSTNAEHVFTPPGFRHPDGPLATRIALQASAPPAEDDSDAIVEARRQGYAIARGSVAPVRYAVAAVVPNSALSGAALVVALVSVVDFDAESAAERLIHTAQLIGMSLGTAGSGGGGAVGDFRRSDY